MSDARIRHPTWLARTNSIQIGATEFGFKLFLCQKRQRGVELIATADLSDCGLPLGSRLESLDHPRRSSSPKWKAFEWFQISDRALRLKPEAEPTQPLLVATAVVQLFNAVREQVMVGFSHRQVSTRMQFDCVLFLCRRAFQ